jgi:hypothetical protein
MKRSITLLLALAACNGPKLDLGGGPADGSAGGDSVPAEQTQGATEFRDSAATCGYPVISAACVYSGGCSDGSGYLQDPPGQCSEPLGAMATFTSTVQVASALVGVWSVCSGGGAGFIPEISSERVDAIEFTSDGRFLLFTNATGTADSRAAVPGNDPLDTGTFEVVDASATLGAGTFQVRLTASDGGVHAAQVEVFPSEPRIRFFSPDAADYMPTPTKRYQTNICGPAFGPIDTPSDGDAALARMQGRWARCPTPGAYGLGASGLDAEGIEFPGDGTWFALVQNASGTLERATDENLVGTVAVSGSNPAELMITSQADVTGGGSSGGSTSAIAGRFQPILGACGTLGWESASGSEVMSFEYIKMP